MCCGTGSVQKLLVIPDLYLCSTGKAMMPLNLKSIRHLLTAPPMQTKSTEETLVLPGVQPYRQSHKLGHLRLGPASGHLMGEHVKLDCSWVYPFLSLGVPGRGKDSPLKMMNGRARGKTEVGSPPSAKPGLERPRLDLRMSLETCSRALALSVSNKVC